METDATIQPEVTTVPRRFVFSAGETPTLSGVIAFSTVDNSVD
jgi:hypothetical protein